MSNYFINPNRNDMFSCLRGLDLQELIVQIENLYLTYRDTLNFPENLTFGVELEYERVSKKLVDRYINGNFNNWQSTTDGSLSSGGEIVSPKMHDNSIYWKELQLICNYLKEHKADTFRHAGGHIHIGAHILGNNIDNWRLFIKLYTAYESVFFRFAAGDKVSLRKTALEKAPSNADFLYENMSAIEKAKSIYNLSAILPLADKRPAINFYNVEYFKINNTNSKNTIEFRIPNATVEEVIVQNNINTSAKLMLAPSKGLIDEDFLNYKLKYEHISTKDTYMYNEVCLKNALEFVDMVFDNNLDKVYFLRQYIKGFEQNFDIKYAVKAKRFVF